MAAFLNKPSDFAKTKAQSVDPSQLIPPHAFETSALPKFPTTKSQSKQDVVSQDVTQAREEIAKLRQEIETLRCERQRFAANSESPKVHIVQQPSSKDETKYADELINRQSREIEGLQEKIRLLQSEHKRQIEDMERQITLQERDADHRVSGLELAIRENEERYEQQVGRLSHQHQKELDDVNSALDNTTRELSQTKSEYVARLRGLETEIESLRSDSGATITQLESELRSKTLQVENQNEQIRQLKRYIGETEQSYQPAEVWRKERETLNNKLKICTAEKENILSNMELLNIRFKSMSEILTVQEAELSKNKTDTISKPKQEGFLLSKWRDKVFALLVQQKSADFVYRKDEQNWKEKVNDLQGKLQSCENQVEVLKHALSEKQAELQMEKNDSQKFQEQITQAQQVALCLDDQLVENRDSAENLKQFADCITGQFSENVKTFQQALATLKTYGQRISFASGRVDMLRGQFARKEALLRLQAKDQDRSPLEAEQDGPEESTSHLSQELEKVISERDLLANQLQQDAHLMSDRLEAARAEYENEVTTLKQTVEDLEVLVQQKSQACESLSVKLEHSLTELDEATEKTSVLRNQLSKQEFATQSALESQRKVDQEEYAQRIAEMDRALNDARREHTKAVVSLRQLERQSGREKERLKEEQNTLEEHYRRQVEKLHQQLVSVEKERNIMMATLRQEGLMSKVRSERSEPVILQSQEEDKPLSNKATVPSEPIASVINDLKSLTTAVLEEGDESGDDTEEENQDS